MRNPATMHTHPFIVKGRGQEPTELATLANWKPRAFFWLNLLYFGILAFLLIDRRLGYLGVNQIEDPIGGLVPLAIPWFGALGAVLISMYGVFDWNQQWDYKWNYWHAARPVVGCVLAVIAFLIFIGLINATGATPNVAATPRDNLPYLVLAFLVGFREETFRALVKRAVDIVLGPGIPGQTPPSVVITANPTHLGDALQMGSAQEVVIVVGNSATADVPLLSAEARVSPAEVATANVRDLTGEIVRAASNVIGKVVITPLLTGAFSVDVVISGPFGTRTVTVTGTVA